MRTADHPHPRRARLAAATAGAIALSLCLLGCQPEPGLNASPSASGSASASESAPASPPATSADPTATATDPPADGFTVPASCEAIYSPSMLASLNSQNPPLNDPGVTMTSSQNVDALETLAAGIPSIRCSWGRAGSSGLATSVSIIDGSQSEALLASFAAAGFGCEAFDEGTLCRIEQKTINLDDEEVTIAEAQFIRGTGWVSTTMINFAPEGYTQDIVATLWG